MDDGLQVGTVELGMAGPITFGPGGVLFVADSLAAKIYAVEIDQPDGAAEPAGLLELDDVDVRIGSYLGCDPSDVRIRDMAIQPGSGDVVLSVQRGRGDAGRAVLVRIGREDGSIGDISLVDVPMAEVTLDDAPSVDDERIEMTVAFGDEGEEVTYGDLTFRLLQVPIRTSTVTDMAFVDGQLLVAGLSNEEFSSKLRRIPFPFGGPIRDTNLEIFHVSHGKWETAAPIRTLVPYEDGRSILASYTCTPVVHIPLSDAAGTKTVGRTVAELGAVNTPLDMVSYRDADGEHLLVANSSHGLIKISCRDIDAQEPLTEPQQPQGVPRETSDLQGIVRLANLDPTHVLVLQATESDGLRLRSLKTESI
jgi:hypothetical protein